MRRLFVAITMMVCMGLVGCTATQNQPAPSAGKSRAEQLQDLEMEMAAAAKVEIKTPFSAKDASYINKRGGNTIFGQGLLRTKGGDVRTSAGSKAFLYPVTPYTEEWMTALFKNTKEGMNSIIGLTYVPVKREIKNADPDLHKYVKEQICDAQGGFEFSGIPDGQYFVVTTVEWQVPNRNFTGHQGGDLMKRVKVSGGTKERVIVTSQ
jgi:uncharacterized protein YceK